MYRTLALSIAITLLSAFARAEDETTGEKVSKKAVEYLDSAGLIQYGFTFGIAGVVATHAKGGKLNQEDVSFTAMPYVFVSPYTVYRAFRGRRIVNKYCATQAIRLSRKEAEAAADELAVEEAKAESKEYRDAVAELRFEEQEFEKATRKLAEHADGKRDPYRRKREAALAAIDKELQDGTIDAEKAKTKKAEAWTKYKADVQHIEAWYVAEQNGRLTAHDQRMKAVKDRFEAKAAAALTRDRILDATGWDIGGPPGACVGTWFGIFGGFPIGYSGTFHDHGEDSQKRDVTTRGAFGVAITPFPYLSVLFGVTRTATTRKLSAEEADLDLGWSYVAGLGGNVDIFGELFK